jgi:hypothetical protein
MVKGSICGSPGSAGNYFFNSLRSSEQRGSLVVDEARLRIGTQPRARRAVTVLAWLPFGAEPGVENSTVAVGVFATEVLEVFANR